MAQGIVGFFEVCRQNFFSGSSEFSEIWSFSGAFLAPPFINVGAELIW
jgi:hypothetical protein